MIQTSVRSSFHWWHQDNEIRLSLVLYCSNAFSDAMAELIKTHKIRLVDKLVAGETSLCLSVCLSVSVCLPLSVSLYIYLSLYIFIYIYIYLSLFLLHLPLHLPHTLPLPPAPLLFLSLSLSALSRLLSLSLLHSLAFPLSPSLSL